MDFVGKIVAITGGVGGIGYEVCQQLLDQGVDSLAIMDLNDPMDRITKLKTKYNTTNILYIKTDVTNKQDVAIAFKKIIEQFKTIDIFIGGAGILDETKIESTMAVNFLGVVYTTLNAIEIMGINNGGRGGKIIIIGSVASFSPCYSLPIYTASKHAVLGFISSLSCEHYYAKFGIAFCVICPYITDTPLYTISSKNVMFPNLDLKLDFKHINTPAEMAKLISDIIKIAKNGAVWIADKTIRQITLPKYTPKEEI